MQKFYICHKKKFSILFIISHPSHHFLTNQTINNWAWLNQVPNTIMGFRKTHTRTSKPNMKTQIPEMGPPSKNQRNPPWIRILMCVLLYLYTLLFQFTLIHARRETQRESGALNRRERGCSERREGLKCQSQFAAWIKNVRKK